jgi:hypothetical protein
MLRLMVAAATLLLAACADAPQWYKGNLHTHSYWSDGDQFPEVILQGYRDRGYAFVSMSDHNVLAKGERWVAVSEIRNGETSLAEYLDRFGEDWVESRRTDAGNVEVRLKRFDEYASAVAEPGRFIVVQGEEITDAFASRPLHVNATNVAEFVPPQGGNSVADVLQRNIDAVLEQRDATGQPMFPHVNHPNFGWAVTAEDLMDLQGERFFEVYNGHPAVHNQGDSLRPSTERIWDIVLTHRLTNGMDVMYGIAVDDAHHYEQIDAVYANPVRGWVMVRAEALTADAIVYAMEAGQFYGSTGVTLGAIGVSATELAFRIEGEPGVTYETEFVGTRRGFDTTTVEAEAVDGLPVTRHYSDDIGMVFARVPGLEPRYTFAGDELYVRARIRSSKPMERPVQPGETEKAWVQPVVVSGGSE